MDFAVGMSDAELIRRSRRHAGAFDELFVRHAADIRNYFARRVDSDASALELTAEVFAQAWSARKRIKVDEHGNAGAWLQGVANNLYRQWARHRRLEADACRRLGVDRSLFAEDDIAERIDAQRLGPEALRRLSDLPPAQREAVSLRVLHELPYDAIARRMSCTPELARMRVSRGLRSIGFELEREAAR